MSTPRKIRSRSHFREIFEKTNSLLDNITDECVDHNSIKVLSFEKIERKKSTGSGKKNKMELNDELSYE